MRAGSGMGSSPEFECTTGPLSFTVSELRGPDLHRPDEDRPAQGGKGRDRMPAHSGALVSAARKLCEHWGCGTIRSSGYFEDDLSPNEKRVVSRFFAQDDPRKRTVEPRLGRVKRISSTHPEFGSFLVLAASPRPSTARTPCGR